MSDSSATTQRVTLVAIEYAFLHILLPTSVVVVAFVPDTVSLWVVLALAVAATALLSRLLTPRARALIALESIALDGLNPAASRYVKASLWGRWGLASSVMGLNRSLGVFAVLVTMGSAIAIGLEGDARFAFAFVAMGLVLLMPAALLWSLQERAGVSGVVNAVAAGARGDAGSLQQASVLLRDQARAALWPDSPV